MITHVLPACAVMVLAIIGLAPQAEAAFEEGSDEYAKLLAGFVGKINDEVWQPEKDKGVDVVAFTLMKNTRKLQAFQADDTGVKTPRGTSTICFTDEMCGMKWVMKNRKTVAGLQRKEECIAVLKTLWAKLVAITGPEAPVPGSFLKCVDLKTAVGVTLDIANCS